MLIRAILHRFKTKYTMFQIRRVSVYFLPIRWIYTGHFQIGNPTVKQSPVILLNHIALSKRLHDSRYSKGSEIPAIYPKTFVPL